MDGYQRFRDKQYGTDEMVSTWCQNVSEASEETKVVMFKEESEEIERVEDVTGIQSPETLINWVNQIYFGKGESMQGITTVAQTDVKMHEDTDEKTIEKTTVVTNEVSDSNTEATKLTKRRKYGMKSYNGLSIFCMELISKNCFSLKSVGKHYSLPRDLMDMNYTLWKKIKNALIIKSIQLRKQMPESCLFWESAPMSQE